MNEELTRKCVGNIEINTQKESIEVIISPHKPSKVMFSGLLLLIAICFVFPLTFLFIEELDIGFGYLLALLIFWGTAIYFFRQLLWNFYGKEKYVFSKNRLLHFFDYGLFRDNVSEIEFKHLKLGYIGIKYPDKIFSVSKRNGPKSILCYLVVIVDDQTIESPILINYENVYMLLNLLSRDEYSKQSSHTDSPPNGAVEARLD